eukprot:226300_1
MYRSVDLKSTEESRNPIMTHFRETFPLVAMWNAFTETICSAVRAHIRLCQTTLGPNPPIIWKVQDIRTLNEPVHDRHLRQREHDQIEVRHLRKRSVRDHQAHQLVDRSNQNVQSEGAAARGVVYQQSQTGDPCCKCVEPNGFVAIIPTQKAHDSFVRSCHTSQELSKAQSVISQKD